MDSIKSDHNVLVIYESKDNLESFVESLTKMSSAQITKQRPSEIPRDCKSAFDFVLSGLIPPHDVQHTAELLGLILKNLKPDGKAIIKEMSNDPSKFVSELKMSGFTKISDPVTTSGVSEFTCQKPNFEIGSSAPLNFGKNVASVWKIDDTVDDEVDTIDPDNLLDEDDLKKPDQASLRVCSTTGKRKACKDCSCGLALELEMEAKGNEVQTDNVPKSSCGNCYLGDAFRCASCPYRGMPAFKPGEKIQLTNDQLEADS